MQRKPPKPPSRAFPSFGAGSPTVTVEPPDAPPSEIPVDFDLGPEPPTGKSVNETLRGRVDSLLDEQAPQDQERALRLIADWLACGTEARHALSWLARLLARERQATPPAE